MDNSSREDLIVKVRSSETKSEKYAALTADWDEYIYTFNGDRYKLNPYFVENDRITQMLIESEIYVKAEEYEA